MDFSFKGKKVLITGASRGIGRAIALGFAVKGASLVLHAKSHSEALEEVVHSCSGLADGVNTWICDLTDSGKLQTSLNQSELDVDILVLNASMEIRREILSNSVNDIQEQVSCNLISSIILAQYFTPLMCANGWGRVIGIGSIQEIHANPTLSVYASLKTAQSHYLKTLAKQVAESGVTVNTVAPGAILTDRNKEVLSNIQFRREVESKIPTGKIGNPEDCTGSVLFLASDLAKYITGAWLPVDGGFHIG